MSFLFEKLEVYQKSLEWVRAVEDMIRLIGNDLSFPFANQLTRAALSIPLNIAEGNGRWHRGEKLQFLRIARGAIFECVAVLQFLHGRKLIADSLYEEAYQQLETLSKMLHGLILSVDNRKAS
jgi:four helix bundle protein